MSYSLCKLQIQTGPMRTLFKSSTITKHNVSLVNSTIFVKNNDH